MTVEAREDWWWVDYLENEMDPGIEQDLKVLLENSETDRQAFESIRMLKEWLVESDPALVWPVEDIVKKVHANVMSQILTMDAPLSEEDCYFFPTGMAATKALRV